MVKTITFEKEVKGYCIRAEKVSSLLDGWKEYWGTWPVKTVKLPPAIQVLGRISSTVALFVTAVGGLARALPEAVKVTSISRSLLLDAQLIQQKALLSNESTRILSDFKAAHSQTV